MSENILEVGTPKRLYSVLFNGSLSIEEILHRTSFSREHLESLIDAPDSDFVVTKSGVSLTQEGRWRHIISDGVLLAVYRVLSESDNFRNSWVIMNDISVDVRNANGIDMNNLSEFEEKYLLNNPDIDTPRAEFAGQKAFKLYPEVRDFYYKKTHN